MLHPVEGDDVSVMRGFGPFVARAAEYDQVIAVDGHARVMARGLLDRADGDQAGEKLIRNRFSGGTGTRPLEPV